MSAKLCICPPAPCHASHPRIKLNSSENYHHYVILHEHCSVASKNSSSPPASVICSVLFFLSSFYYYYLCVVDTVVTLLMLIQESLRNCKSMKVELFHFISKNVSNNILARVRMKHLCTLYIL